MLFVLFFCFLTLSGFSQKKEIEKADALFYQKKYGEAYWQYKQIYQKKQDKNVLLKMADCNFSIENYVVAQEYYAKYFSDTIYMGIEQFNNYALSAKKIGKVILAAKLYQKIYENKQDGDAKTNYELYKLYADSISKTRSFNLDSNYNCIVLDASESIDPDAQPMIYIWNFGDGVISEGITIEHCFKKLGENLVGLSVRDKKTGVVHLNDTTLKVYIEGLPIKFTAPKEAKQYIDSEFDGSESNVKNSDLLEYIWDMGNGETSRGKKIKYRYANKGVYAVKLTVIAEDKTTKVRNLYSSYRYIEVLDIYSTPSKTFTDKLNEAK